jgi:hypothetical protein
MMMRRTIFLILLQLPTLHGIGQNGVSFDPPLKIPLYLSSNFGEIRMDHFHSGIDIKTQGVTGHRVYSVEKGYVSRIKVQTNGYGNSIYITHPNGYTSQYGHLDRYRDDIAAFVKRMQYKQQSQTVDLYLGRETFPVARGKFIAYSGNTGGSTGPHLHFELRNSANEHPVNVLKFKFNIRDQIAPRFLSIYLYPMDGASQVNGKTERMSSRLVKDKGIYAVPYGTRMEGWGTIGMSVQVFDYMNGTSNRYGIYKLEMYVDNKLSYSYIMNEFSFSDTRYVNAHLDYGELIRSGIKAHRLFRLPNDRLKTYDQAAGNRPLTVNETRDYPIRIVASDVAGNSAELEFTIKGNKRPVDATATGHDPNYVTTMQYNQDNSFEDGPVSLKIPANALYQDLDFQYDITPPADGSLTPFYHIASNEVPVHSSYTLSIKSPDVDPALYNKLLFISYDNEGEVVPSGGRYRNGTMETSLRNFGAFAIALDTVSPEIIPLNEPVGNDYSGREEMRFNIRDDLSGIEKYEGYIDNNWALFEYDPKRELLLYKFDETSITRESQHELELYVSDERGNTSLLNTAFYW